ncbi:caspase domain-containing protein [Rhizoctonia solani]|nr:caspase domain-containing protein [Rhizoctonia solani]
MWRLLLILCFLDSLATIRQLKTVSDVGAERPTSTNRFDNACPVALSATTTPTTVPSTPITVPSASVLKSPTTILAGPSDPPATPIISVTNTPVIVRPSRGLSRAAASSTSYGHPGQADSAASVSASVREATKKALVMGFNYKRCGKGNSPLRHAAQDALRFAKTLTKLGYTSENVKVVTDEENQPLPSSESVLQCIDWLVDDLLPGDRRTFMFSGHCVFPMGQEPHLVVADSTTITRSTFQDRLIARIPIGVELTLVLDCCHAAAMVKTRYCVSRMGYKYEPEKTDEPKALSQAEGPITPVLRPPSQFGSFQGLPAVNEVNPPLTLQSVPVVAKQVSFGSHVTVPSRPNRGGVAAAPLAPLMMHPATGIMPKPTAVMTGNTKPIQARRMVVAGAPILSQFQERKSDYVTPAGKVIIWAAAGERQKAYEASGGLENGIFTNALCKVLDTCGDKLVTHRELWDAVVGALDQENSWRYKRDTKKPERPPINTRVQCAELLVAQQSPLYSSSPILNRPVC